MLEPRGTRMSRHAHCDATTLFARDQETRSKTFAAESFRLGIFRRTCPSKDDSFRRN